MAPCMLMRFWTRHMAPGGTGWRHMVSPGVMWCHVVPRDVARTWPAFACVCRNEETSEARDFEAELLAWWAACARTDGAVPPPGANTPGVKHNRPRGTVLAAV
ncbi:hypothetical protein GCM10022232_90140 [Streptomyces plumbiresistens]|uniref:Uncharacterized protein n=1 Tax=Streptomyces plumbiresistens TaxID=511811 RepID=A0ABP7TRJ4_9ACTN